jgi:glycosyltransferase involved in cell wall biosynthesis
MLPNADVERDCNAASTHRQSRVQVEPPPGGNGETGAMPRSASHPLVLMLGTDEGTRGGISAVVGVLRRRGLFERNGARYVATHCDGSRWRKVAVGFAAWLRVAGLLAAGRVALLHVHTASGPSFWRKSLFVAAARAMRVPYVLHVHGGGFLDFYRRGCGPLRRAWVRGVLRGSGAVVALSQHWQQVFLEMAPGCRCVVIANPVEIPPWSAALDETPPTVVFLGLISEAKGIADLARAWPDVAAAVPHARLVLAGTGDVDRLRRLFAAHGDAVQFPGWISGADKDALLRRAWVFALPSHFEALPMSILESMAAGVPVVATRIGGVPLAVRDGETGVLIEPGDIGALRDALIALLTDRERRIAYGRAARQRAMELFAAETQLDRIAALWRDVLGQTPG